jgi:hypothetical protein
MQVHEAAADDILIKVRQTGVDSWCVVVVYGYKTNPWVCLWKDDAPFAEADTYDEAKDEGERLAREVGGAELLFHWSAVR